MKRSLTRNLKSQAGMTLIEIMVVIAIIGSIAALATVKIMSSLEESRVETTKVQIQNIQTALDNYRRKHGSYPTTEQGLQSLVEKPTVGKIPENYPEEGYMTTVPKDGWGNAFDFSSPGTNGHKVEIVSYGADGAPGGEGNDADLMNYTIKEEGATP